MSDEERTVLDRVMTPHEEPHPDHRGHAKEQHPPDDEELERRVRHEREVTGADGPVRDRP